jgi:hypothetical protein
MRDSQGVDHCFYTLGNEELLTDAKPIEEVYFHGQRPYEMGYAILETHKTFKTSMPALVRPLQQETNSVANDRIDNVKFVLHKRWFVARGRQTDVQSLVRGAPGGVTLTTDPKTDIQESNWPDVTSSAYVEQDRLSADFDELAGNFTPSTKVANNAVNDTLGGSRMAAQGAGLMTDYLLRTVIETWWEKVLRQLVKLEAYYETDEKILALCANKARLFPRYGLSRITDELLTDEVTLSVNVGMGSSNPQQRMQNFLMATNAAIALVQNAPPGFNVQEGVKEIYSNAGYRDGTRFLSSEQDPRLLKAMQLIQSLQGALQAKQMDLKSQERIEGMKLMSNEKIKGAEIRVNAARIDGDLQLKRAQLVVEEQRLELEKLQIQAELYGMDQEHKGKLAELSLKIEEANAKLEHERMKINALALKTASDLANAEAESSLVQSVQSNEQRLSVITEEVAKAMQNVAGAIGSIKGELASTKSSIDGSSDELENIKRGLSAVALVVGAPKRKAKGFKLRKKDGKKTDSILVEYDDGTADELKVGSS